MQNIINKSDIALYALLHKLPDNNFKKLPYYPKNILPYFKQHLAFLSTY